MSSTGFEWDLKKDEEHKKKHGVSFYQAQYVFADVRRVIARDLARSHKEDRFYCFGKVEDGILTVRFTHRSGVRRIIGAGYWRKGKIIYERENKIQR